MFQFSIGDAFHFLFLFMRTGKRGVSILHWRCGSMGFRAHIDLQHLRCFNSPLEMRQSCEQTKSEGWGGRGFNSPLEMQIDEAVMLARRLMVSILHWRCLNFNFKLASTSYSSGFNSPLEMQANIEWGRYPTRLSFNSPLEMPMAVRAKTCAAS